MAQRFVVSYFVWLGVLFGVFYWDVSPLSHGINEFLRLKLISIIDMGLEPGRVHGSDIIINPHYKLIIEKACNGMIPVLMYMASIFAYPASWSRRLYWAVGGAMTMLVLNVIRIFIVIYFVLQGGRENFSLSHDVFGNAVFMFAGLLLFYFFINGTHKVAKT